MILKQSPTDFRVEELTDSVPSDQGEFAFYQLNKQGWNTLQVLDLVRERWHVGRPRMSVAGLKDRHADTTQYFTILHGPKQSLEFQRAKVTYLGQVLTPYESVDIRANRFIITLRQLNTNEIHHAQDMLERIGTVPLPNYFDDQRFGSVSDGQYVAREMVLGNFEQALRLAIANPYSFDHAVGKRNKQYLRDHWGDWGSCLQFVRSRPIRPALQRLQHKPTDFLGACTKLPQEWLVLYLHAYQSSLWNRLLDRWIRHHSTPAHGPTLMLRSGQAMLPFALNPEARQEWATLELPYPSPRLKIDPNARWAPLLQAIMTEEGITLKQMTIAGLHRPFFSKGERSASITVAALHWQFADDERHPDTKKLTLSFELPRGCYATMLLKCLGVPGPETSEEP